MSDRFTLHTSPNAFDAYAAPAVGSYFPIPACVNANATTGFAIVWFRMAMVRFHSYPLPV